MSDVAELGDAAMFGYIMRVSVRIVIIHHTLRYMAYWRLVHAAIG